MRVNQPQSGPAQIDPAYGADFAWNAATGSSVGAPVSTNNGRRSAVKSGIGLNSGYAIVSGKIPSLFRTTWTECGIAFNDGVNAIAALSARGSGQAITFQPGSNNIDIVMWGVADVNVGGVIPLGIFHYAVRRVGSAHTVWINGKLFGSASDSGTPAADVGISPAIGAQAGSDGSQGVVPLVATNAVLGLFRTPRALSDAQCIALSRNHWDAYAGEQEDIFSPATGGGSSYSYTASGGFVLSGVATKVRGAARAASGGIATGGTASARRGTTRATSGGLIFAGAATQSKGRAIVALGGLAVSGAASVVRRAVRAAAGGIQFAGAATVTFFSGSQSRVVVATGGMIISGAAAIRRSIRKLAMGGVLFSGAATVTRTDRTPNANEYFTTIMRISTVYVDAGAPSSSISTTGQINGALSLTTIMRASTVNVTGTMSAAPINLTGNLL